ncbi:hypothetical protein ACO2FM_09910 [Staphylococcus pasteuri]
MLKYGKNETKSKVEYSIVSKWDEKKSFQNWVSRPSHVEEHKKNEKRRKRATRQSQK